MIQRPVLLTRAQADSKALAAILQNRGIGSFIEPMISIDMLGADWPSPTMFDGLILTSAHAVSAIPAGWRDHPVYAVGTNSAECAREHGFSKITVAGGNAEALIRLLIETLPVGTHLLHPCGVHLAATISVPGSIVEQLSVYKACAATELSSECRKVLRQDGFSHALFFSPRTGRIFRQLIRDAALTAGLRTTKALCLSGPVVESVQDLPWEETLSAAHPDRAGMLDLLQQHGTTAR